ncbi:uncharacterized protein B0P05DRAFT_531232 [Gilbertella persicaria]|uniref:uncharacterized protein n=1 Tax=Gilbertella persicaria TaxID=101096 RepID=UPI00221F3B95|nr:uncharacterized protein B0P05DRAFT_531232 [Gilbertella persicaria]KAI8088044.1 hypothetical protein B0P05DRAFT_531232 [Gilbertella persicaria]
MHYYNQDKDNPNLNSQLFGQSFEEMNSNSFLDFETSHSLPTHYNTSGQDFLSFGKDDISFLNENIFLDNQQQILLSDPSFVRQQQLLQQQEKQKTTETTPVRSNLSAMFDINKTPQVQPIQLVTGHQTSPKPIPIASTNHLSSSVPSDPVDHQRRFNELQARFRKLSTEPLGSSVPTHYDSKLLSSSFTEGSIRRKSSLDPSSTKPILRINREGGKIKSNKSSNMAIPSPNSNTTNASSFPSRTMPIQIQRVQRASPSQPFDLEQRQKRLDDQLVKVDFDDITVAELKEMLRQRGKPATGKKAVLLQRLQDEREMICHARTHGIPILNRNAPPQLTEGSSPVMQSPLTDHAASLPESMYLSSSPMSTSLGGLNRSIADMHIGSPPPPPPVQPSRRFAPYTATRSNMISNYSSSMPTGHLDAMMMMQPTQPSLRTYAPFAPSALATPDKEDEHNPFDDYNNTMDWTDPSLDFLLQNGK